MYVMKYFVSLNTLRFGKISLLVKTHRIPRNLFKQPSNFHFDENVGSGFPELAR